MIVELERLRAFGARIIGVVSQFRAQADALEAAVLGRFSTDDLEALDLRVGTVHAFQGNERDTVLASLGVGHEADSASWRFVEDPHLFTVLVTRSRRHFTVVVSGDPPAGGLVAAYLAQADTPPGPPTGGPPASAWVAEVADGLCSGGVPPSPRTRAVDTSSTSVSSAPATWRSRPLSTVMVPRRTWSVISR